VEGGVVIGRMGESGERLEPPIQAGFEAGTLPGSHSMTGTQSPLTNCVVACRRADIVPIPDRRRLPFLQWGRGVNRKTITVMLEPEPGEPVRGLEPGVPGLVALLRPPMQPALPC
jgi:hypothetical protein